MSSWSDEGGPRAGSSLGAEDASPMWFNIFLMILGSSMAAMILTAPWHFEQTVMSMLNTRFNSRAHDIRLDDAAGLSASASALFAAANANSVSCFGTICLRYL